MKHLVCVPVPDPVFSVGVWGPSVPCRGARAERSFWGRGDVLVFRGTRPALLAVRATFACAPGVFALRVVRALDSALCPGPSSPFLPGL